MTSSGDQLALPGMPRPRRRARSAQGVEIADERHVVSVIVDVSTPHLDRPFDYLVPAKLSEQIEPGVRVRVRFNGRDIDALVTARSDETDFVGELQPVRRVVSPVVVAPENTRAFCAQVGAYYATSVADVLTAAIPPRHARTEAAVLRAAPGPWAGGGGTVGGDDGAVGASVNSAGGAAAGVTAEIAAETQREAADSFRTIWHDYTGGSAFLSRLAAGQTLRAAWTALPHAQHPDAPWARGIASLVAMVGGLGRGVIVVLPDDRDVNYLCAALGAEGLTEWTPDWPGHYVRLQASQGVAARYGAYIAAVADKTRIVIGTRAAAYVPVADLSIVVCWDDQDASHRAERTPRTSTATLLELRSELEDVSVLLAGPSRSLEVQRLVESGWARAIEADRATVRHRAPRVRALTDVDREVEGGAGASRIPPQAWRVLRDGLANGPVLVQVPRKGYVLALACAKCRSMAHCRQCSGPLQLTADWRAPQARTSDVGDHDAGVRASGDYVRAVGDGARTAVDSAHEQSRGASDAQRIPGSSAQCGWCGALAGHWRCPECGDTHLRSVRVGSQRTAEELGRAFPKVPVRVSGLGTAAGVLDEVPDRPCLVVSTPGAEPRAAGGYAAAALLDADVLVAAPHVDAEVMAVHHWFVAGGLVRSADAGGQVVIVGDAPSATTQALVRWDPAGYAERELGERSEAGLPPAVRVAVIIGESLAVGNLLRTLQLPPGAEVLGPAPWHAPRPRASAGARGVQDSPRDRAGARSPRPISQVEAPVALEIDHHVRAIVKAPRSRGRELAIALRAARSTASAARQLGSVHIELDPADL